MDRARKVSLGAIAAGLWINAAVSVVTPAHAQRTTLEYLVETMQIALYATQGDVSRLRSDLGDVESKASTLDSDVETLRSDVSSLRSRVSDLEFSKHR